MPRGLAQARPCHHMAEPVREGQPRPQVETPGWLTPEVTREGRPGRNQREERETPRWVWNVWENLLVLVLGAVLTKSRGPADSHDE